MHFSLSAAVLAVGVSAVAAQTVHTVLVGDGGALAFNPPNITAAKGDKVAFEFRAKNHTVTQSTFTAPCVPGTFNGSAGADSGFAAVPANNTLQPGQFPTWTITINVDTPLWFHCAQNNPKNHCQAGMVFSINETPEKSFEAYLANAKAFDPATLAAPAAASGNSSMTVAPDTSGDSSVTLGSPAGSSSPDVASSSIDVAAPATTLVAGGAAPVAVPTGAANAGTLTSPESSNSNDTTVKSGAASVVVSRGAAGLFAALTIGAVLL